MKNIKMMELIQNNKFNDIFMTESIFLIFPNCAIMKKEIAWHASLFRIDNTNR